MPLPPIPRSSQKAIGQILAAVKKHRTFFLTGHERPDGDTVGSELAFAGFLRRRGKKVTVANTGPVPALFDFLPGVRNIQTAARVPGRFDCAVVFECSGPDRMGNIIDLKTQAGTVINIDHHAHHSRFGHINLINPKTSSNSEQLAYVFERARHTLNRAEATALYVGLVTDSGRFQHNCTTPESHAVAALLLRRGVDVAEVHRHVYGTRSVSALRLLARALAGLRLELDQRVAVLSLTQKDFAETGAGEDDTEDIVNHGLLPPSVAATVFLCELPKGGTKASLRGKGAVDLCRLAVSLGGGGHKNAAGVTLPVSLERATQTLLDALAESLR
jgi:phosphoesterase RecJ-like protein